MKSKKGFTLIELLAVVIIIALLVLIAFPAISKYLIDTENDTYSLHEAELKSATANMMSQCIQGNVEDCVPDNGESRTVYLSELIAQKYSSPIKDPANSENMCSASDTYVVVTNSTSNVVNLEYQVCLVCSEYKSAVCETVKPNDTCNKETDPERPVCGTAVGASTVWTNADRIVSIGCSDTGCGCTQGTFYKRFEENAKQGVITVVDKAGNYTDCVVDVYVDKEVPTCSLTVEGNLGENGWYGGSAPVVKLTYNNADISGIATYGMGVSSKNPDLNKKTSYTVSPGITTIYGYVKDNAGNVGMCSVPIQYDPVVPTGEITYGYQVYPKSDIATVDGRNIKLNSFIGEYGNVLGANIYLKSNTSGMSVTIYKGSTEIAKRTISAGVTFMKFSFTGNYNGLTIDMGNASNIALIERIELITDQTTGYYTNKDVIVYATSKDSFSGKGYYSFDGSAWQTSNSYTYGSNVINSTAKIKDFAGNESDPIEFDITNVDKEVPSCYITTEFEPDGKNNWFISNFGLEVHPSDLGVSNVRDHNITTDSNPSYTTTLTARQTDDTKITTWHGYVRDKAGNVNRCSIDIKLDKVDPVCKIKVPQPDGANNWYISDVVVDYTDSDETSGVVFRGMNVSGTRDYNNVRRMDLNYETKTENFYCYVEDESGRTNQDSEPYKLDKTDPTCVITPDREIDGENGWYIADVKLTFATTSDISPITGYDFINSATFSYTNKRYTHTISSSTKGVTYYGYAQEESGRTSTCNLHVKMDEDKPTCSFDIEGTIGNNSWYTSNIKFTLKPVDPISDIQNKGIVSSNSKNYNGSGSVTHTQDKTNIKYWGFVKDNAGNENYCDSGAALKKDATAPNSCTLEIISGTLGKRGWYTSNVGLEITTDIADNLSGVVGYDIVAAGSSPVYSHNDDSYTVTANSTSTAGTEHTAYIKDYAGNVRTCDVVVKKDSSSPYCYVSPSGTLGLNNWYRSTVTLTLNVYDNTGGDLSDMYQYGVQADSYSYNSKSTAKQTSDTNVYKWFYGQVEDQAGNTGQCRVAVRKDSVAPSCTLGVTSGTLGDNSWYKSNVNLSFVNGSGDIITPTDSGSGMLRYNITSISSANYSGGKKTITVYSNTGTSGRTYYGYVQDRAGNSNYCTKTIKKDTSTPSCSLSTSGTKGENGYFVSDVTVTAKPYDSYSGVYKYSLTTSSSPSYSTFYSSYTTKSETVSGNTEGTTYHCYVKDKAGNINTYDYKVIIPIFVNTPSCSIRSREHIWWFIWGSWNTGGKSYTSGGSVAVELVPSSDSVSYGISVGTNSEVFNGIDQLSLSGESKTIYGYVKDKAGNKARCSAYISHSVSGDKCKVNVSSGSRSGSTVWHQSAVTVTLSGNVDSSKPKKYKFSAVNQSGATTHEVEDVTSLTISGDGVYFVTGEYDDIKCTAMVKIDKTAPYSFTVGKSETATSTSPSSVPVTVTVKAKDATSGVYYIKYGSSYRYISGKDVTAQFTYNTTGNHTKDYIVCDAAGNCTSSKNVVVYVDPCDNMPSSPNYSSWTSCSNSCGEGKKTRDITWTGASGATCSVDDEESCTGTTGCNKVGDFCKLYKDNSSALFGPSIGALSSNYGEFNPDIYHYWCDAGCYTKSGYDKICATSSCGDYYGWSVLAMRAAEEEEGTSHCSSLKAFWCTCNDGYKIKPYTENGQSGYIYSPFFGG